MSASGESSPDFVEGRFFVLFRDLSAGKMSMIRKSSSEGRPPPLPPPLKFVTDVYLFSDEALQACATSAQGLAINRQQVNAALLHCRKYAMDFTARRPIGEYFTDLKLPVLAVFSTGSDNSYTYIVDVSEPKLGQGMHG